MGKGGGLGKFSMRLEADKEGPPEDLTKVVVSPCRPDTGRALEKTGKDDGSNLGGGGSFVRLGGEDDDDI